MKVDRISVNQITESLGKGAEILQYNIPLVEESLDVRKECEVARLQTERVKLENNTQIVRILAKFQTNKDILEKVFGERERSLGKLFDLMDKALDSDDHELLLQSMQQIGKIVTSTPLAEIERLSRLYDDDSQTLLDF